MALDLQPVSESALDLQPVDESASLDLQPVKATLSPDFQRNLQLQQQQIAVKEMGGDNEPTTDFLAAMSEGGDPMAFAMNMVALPITTASAIAGKIAEQPYLAAADAIGTVAGDKDYTGNLKAEFSSQNPDQPLPVEKFFSDLSKTSRALGVVGKLSAGIAETAPMLGVDALPAAAQKLIVRGFTADMLAHAPGTATELYKELKKPTDEQDPDKVSSLISDGVQQLGFGALGAAHEVVGVRTALIDKYVPRGQGMDGTTIPKIIPSTDKAVVANAAPGSNGDVKIPVPTPESAETLKAQVDATRDPTTPKAVTLVTPGATMPENHGLVEVPTAQGTALVNPTKVNPAEAKAQLDAGKGGELLGMSTAEKPAGLTPEAEQLINSGGTPAFVTKNLERISTENGVDPSGKTPNQIIDELKARAPKVLQTKTAAGTPVQDEVVTPKTLPAAIEAGKKVSPDGTQEVKAPEQVVSERLNEPKLIPVDVSEKQLKAMKQSGERAPDILDAIGDHYPGGVKLTGDDFAEYHNIARGQAKELLSKTAGEPADQVLDGLHRNGLFLQLESVDDLAQAMVHAGVTRINERGGTSRDARVLAEQQSRDDLFRKANTSRRGDVESVPVEHLQMGDRFMVNGQPMQVVEFPVDADTGKPFGVTLEGAYGRQHVDVGQKIHMDGGSLKETPEFVGMGGAVPGEFENSAATPVGIKVAAIDAQRAARGLEPLTKTAARSFSEETWQRTLAQIDDNPDAPKNLVAKMQSELDAGKPRALTDGDVAMLLYREADLTYQRAKLMRDMAQAQDDAAQFPNRAEELPAMKLERARIADELDKLEQVIGPARSETGRGLAALRHMVGDNYTLTAMEFSRRAAKGGAALAPTEHAELVKLRAQIEASQTAIEKATADEAEERSKRLADDAISDRISQVEKGHGYDRQVQSLADRIVTALEREAVAARARLKEKFARFNAGLDPTLLTDLATVGAAHIARGTLDFTRWSKAMVSDFGENVIPWLNKAWEKSNARVNTAVDRLASGKQSIEVKKRIRKDDINGQRAKIVAGLKGAAEEKRPLDEQGDYIRKLMENLIASGLKEREPLVDAIHAVLTDEIGLKDVTRRDVREAMSNYGKFKALNSDEIKAKRRDISHQIAQTLKLEDIAAKQPLPKSGVEHHVPSTEGRLLIQQVNEAKRRFGVVVSDPAKQLKSALDARKTWLTNRIADLKFQIDAGERTVKTKSPPAWDAETKRLELEVADLKQQLDELAPKPGLTDAQRLAATERSIERENATLEQLIAAGDVLPKPGKPRLSSERLDALKARRDALRAQRDELRALDPQYQATVEERQMKALLSRLATATSHYADRLERGDFAPKPRREYSWQSSPAVLKARAENAKAKAEFQKGNEIARQKQRNTFERGMDGLAKWKRTFVLSWPTVIGKLFFAAAEGIGITPLEEAVGTPFARALPGISERAPRHGRGLSLRAEVQAITDTVTHLVRNMKDAQTTGRTELDLLYGKPVILPRELKDWVSNFHYALKTPLMQNEFSRSFTKLMQAEAARGVDVTEPLVMQRIGNQAYALAQKAIFKENNLVVNMYRRALGATRDKIDGKQTRTGKAAETALRFTFPVVDIPTTIVKRTFEYMLGAPLGLGRASWAYMKGIENLKPDEAEAIMRNLKRGSLGGAVLLLGFFNADSIGGYYQPGEKRDSKDVKVGGLRLFGHDVPRWMVHNPLLEQLQIGATMRRVADSHKRKSDMQPQGIGTGAWAGLLGLVNEVPFMEGSRRLVDNPTPTQLIGDQAKSMVPGILQFTAQELDQDNQGNTISRQPKTILQNVETGIPGLRKHVPARVTPDVAPYVDFLSRYIPPHTPPDQRAAIRARLAELFKTNSIPASNSVSPKK